MSVSNGSYTIVVAIDYCEASDFALQKAFELAVEKGTADIHVVHVLPAYPSTKAHVVSDVFGSLAPFFGQAAERLRIHIEEKADAFRKAHAEQNLDSLKRIVAHERLVAPAAEIVQVAADLAADLIIVGSHSRRGVSRLLLGSVAEAVVRLAPCPVLVVRPKAPLASDAGVENKAEL